MSPPLEPSVEERLREIGAADVLVGIPSYNNARTIGHVVRAAAAGLAKYFPDQRAVIVNSDGGSSDGTPHVVAAADDTSPETILVRHPVSVVHKIVTPYYGVPGKGSAFRTIFEIAQRLGARACVVVDSDLRSITPEWFELLLGPVLHDGFDYVSPLYSRHKYDGTITNAIVYPLVRALYGARIRQPIGGDFGFSGALAAHFLEHDVWDTDVARFGNSFASDAPGKLTATELADLRQGFNQAYFDAIGKPPSSYEAAVKFYQLDMELGVMRGEVRSGKPIADTLGRLLSALGLPPAIRFKTEVELEADLDLALKPGETNPEGNARLEMVIENASLGGTNDLLGKSVIVHAGPDDLKSDPSGNSGGRIAGGVIEAKR